MKKNEKSHREMDDTGEINGSELRIADCGLRIAVPELRNRIHAAPQFKDAAMIVNQIRNPKSAIRNLKSEI